MWWHFASAWWYVLAAGPAAVGIAVAWWALRSDAGKRSPERRRCPRCWYDLRGVPGMTCPECGRTSRTERELQRSRRHWGAAALGASLVAPLLVVFGVRDGGRAWYALPPRWVTHELVTIGDAEWRSWRERDPNMGGQQLVVSWRSRPVWTLEDYLFDLSAQPVDLDADGAPEVLVGAFTGGANCCFNMYIFSTGGPPRLLAAVDARKGWALRDDPSGPLILSPDMSFLYWRTSGAGSPRPEVFYRLRRGRLVAAPEAIRVPTPAETAAVLERVGQGSEDEGYGPWPEMWAHMLELLYADQADRAWAFFERAWPPGVPGQGDFLFDFAATLSTSPWWRDVQEARAAAAAGREPAPALIEYTAPLPERAR